MSEERVGEAKRTVTNYIVGGTQNTLHKMAGGELPSVLHLFAWAGGLRGTSARWPQGAEDRAGIMDFSASPHSAHLTNFILHRHTFLKGNSRFRGTEINPLRRVHTLSRKIAPTSNFKIKIRKSAWIFFEIVHIFLHTKVKISLNKCKYHVGVTIL